MTAVAEATLQLDQLTGVLAHMFARRLARHEYAEQTVGAAWVRLADRVDVDALVRDYRDRAGIGEAANNPDDEAVARAAALAALSQLVSQAYDESDAEDLDLLRRALTDAIRSGRAEGMADAVMIAADELRMTGMHTLAVDFEIAFKHAYDALEHQAEALAGQSGEWLAQILGDSARDIGRLLAGLTSKGASYEDMVRAVQGVLGSADARAVRTIVDLLTSRAMSRGALDLYASEGVAQVDFVTAGDSRVCPTCTDYEAESPFSIGSAPVPGIHPFCRCVLMPHEIFPSPAGVAAYLEGGT